jgi:hypothetical protein
MAKYELSLITYPFIMVAVFNLLVPLELSHWRNVFFLAERLGTMYVSAYI